MKSYASILRRLPPTRLFKTVVFLFSGFVFCLVFLIGFPSYASVESLTILQSSQIHCGHTLCIEVLAKMNGQASGGRYSVPVRLRYPVNPKQRNDTAIVDVVNSTFQDFTFFDTADSAPDFFPPQPLGRAILGDAFLGDQGYIYFEVNWDKMSLFVCDRLGHPECGGEIAEGPDGYQIIQDAADFVKNPTPELVRYGYSPPTTSIAFGYSQSAYLLQKIYKRENIEMSFDGVLLGGTDPSCATLLNEFPWWTFDVGCEGPMPGAAGKTITVLTESDVEGGAFLLRGDAEWDRSYEIAGSAHIPKSLHDLKEFGAFRQNPVDTSPVFRAMMENLRAWIVQGTRPPENAYLNATGNFFLADLAPFLGQGPVPVFELEREEDCATGGIRLPHCQTRQSSHQLGAPLGAYDGIETVLHFDPEHHLIFRPALVPLGGTFEPFSLAKLKMLYPNPMSYLLRVGSSVIEALEKRWILPKDAEIYLVDAAQCPVGRKNFQTSTPDDLRRVLEECQNPTFSHYSRK